jgi:serine/threonine protein kinase
LNQYLIYESHSFEDHPCFQVINPLGRGTFGEVFQVRFKAGDYRQRICALKRCHLENLKGRNLNMLREVIANMKLSSEVIINYWQYWFKYNKQEEKIVLYFCMGLADGNLRAWLDTNHKRDHTNILHMIINICSALYEIHSRGMVHRDLKPENILIFGELCKFSDFGAVAINKIESETDKAYLTSVLGTEPYIALEIMDGKPYTNKVDIFSLGLICMELIFQFPNQEDSLIASRNLKENHFLPDIFSTRFIEEG